MAGSFRYLLIEGGPHLDLARDLRTRYTAASDLAWAWARKHGAEKVMTDGGGFPQGSRPQRVVGVGHLGRNADRGLWRKRAGGFVPKVTARALVDEMRALQPYPAMPAEISVAIAWVEAPAPGMNFRDPLAQLIWAGDQNGIVVPNCELLGFATVDSARRALDFPVPEGCREISAGEWDLMEVTLNANRAAAAPVLARAGAAR